jgi:hypothetical protein
MQHLCAVAQPSAVWPVRSGIPVHVLNNPGMQLAAQQLVAQRLMQQQLLSGQLRPVLPAQVLAMQQAQLQQRLAASGAAAAPSTAKKGGGGGRRRGGRGSGAAAAAAAPAYVAPVQAQPANPFADPGGAPHLHPSFLFLLPACTALHVGLPPVPVPPAF